MDFIRENPPSHGQIVDFKQLIRKTPPVYGQTEHFESTVLSNKDHSSEQDGYRCDCKAGQRHSPRRIAKHPEQSGLLPLSAIIRHSVSGNYRHITNIISTKNLRIVNK